MFINVRPTRNLVLPIIVLLLLALLVPSALAASPAKGAPTPVRFATFNASLNRFNAGDLIVDLSALGNV